MLQKITALTEEISNVKVNGADELELFRLKYLSKKGLISTLFEDFRNVPAAEKKEIGQKLNLLK
jgi:phenylalanyl-tRNA synthetase alpha chain